MTDNSSILATANDTETREVRAIIDNFSDDEAGRHAINELLDKQLTVLHGRAQSLIQMAGVVITVTGFSGRIIADTSVISQLLIIGGLALVCIAAAITILWVMPIKWMSSYLHLPVQEYVLLSLRLRDRKGRAFTLASAVLILGMLLYVCAISYMLLHPQAAELHKVR
ncbi:MAG: hypothetical protein K1X53_04700 [Candidatus Sumerlaeaceae bacterium]|nr:hypothetical protein [Candidatus Sumerlaeaceae bacterium]